RSRVLRECRRTILRRACVHPLGGSIRVTLALPNWNALLDLLDDVSARVEGGAAMRVARCDHHANVTDREIANTMKRNDPHAWSYRGGFANYGFHLTRCHPGIRRVLQAGNDARVGAVTNRAEERRDGAGVCVSHLIDDCPDVDRVRDHSGPVHTLIMSGSAAGDRRYHGDFVAGSDGDVVGRVFL